MANPERRRVRGSIRVLGLFCLLALGSIAIVYAQENSTTNKFVPGANGHLQLDGELQILQQDFKDHARLSYSLKLQDGHRVPLQFVKEPPTHLLTGDRVTASGQLVNGKLVLYSGSTNLTSKTKTAPPSSSTPPGPVPNSLGPQYTLVILVNFQDDAVQPYTVSDAQTMFSGSANDFVKENSYGQTSIVPTVVGWYTIPESVTTCNLSQIATDAQNAAVSAGADLSNFTRYVYAFPQNNACGFAGSSYIGGLPSQSWINGNNLDAHVIDHELGHAFGLWHSHSLDCGTSETICSSGTVVEYGDLLDSMGTPQTASPDYNAFQKERLGWLNYGASPSITTVSSSGTYTISSYEQGSGPNALKVLKSTDSTTGAKTWYYLEARQAVGFDAFLTNPIYYTQNETTGVLFHLGTDGDGNSSELADMTPATPTTSGWFDPSLVVGQSFTDSAAGVTFTPTSVSSTGATVQITINGSAPAPSSPSAITVTTDQSSYLPGQTVDITVTVLSGTSPDAGASVAVTVTPPSGKSTTMKGITGSDGVVLFSYKVSPRAIAGSYNVNADTGSIAGANTTFTVQ